MTGTCVKLFTRTRKMADCDMPYGQLPVWQAPRPWTEWKPVIIKEHGSFFPFGEHPVWGPFMTLEEADDYIRRNPGSSWESDALVRDYRQDVQDMPGLWGLVDGNWEEKHCPELRSFWDGLEAAIVRDQDPGLLLWGRNSRIHTDRLDDDQNAYVRLFPDQALRVACRGMRRAEDLRRGLTT